MRIYVDGNPNEVCCVTEGGKIERSKIGLWDNRENTNNIAEYRAVLFGLYKHPEVTEVCSDSQLVVKQLNGEYAVKKQHLLPLYERVMRRVRELNHKVKFIWVPREDNLAGKILG